VQERFGVNEYLVTANNQTGAGLSQTIVGSFIDIYIFIMSVIFAGRPSAQVATGRA